jgi:uncharacterized tellurite resistance protein B-like protein
MNKEVALLVLECLMLMAMQDEDYDPKEERLFKQYFKKIWKEDFGSEKTALDTIAQRIESSSATGKSWDDLMKDNALKLSKTLKPNHKAFLLLIMENLYQADEAIKPEERNLYQILKENLGL